MSEAIVNPGSTRRDTSRADGRPAQQPARPISRPRSRPLQLSVRRENTDEPKRIRQQVNVKKITGFGPMTRITTSFGEVYAQALRKGDMVRTPQGNFARIEHIDRLQLDEGFLHLHPSVQPVRIRRGALGPNLPAQDIVVAPYQMIRPGPPRMTVKSVAAEELLGKPFVTRATDNQITYTRIYFTKATSGFCEGLVTEF